MKIVNVPGGPNLNAPFLVHANCVPGPPRPLLGKVRTIKFENGDPFTCRVCSMDVVPGDYLVPLPTTS